MKKRRPAKKPWSPQDWVSIEEAVARIKVFAGSYDVAVHDLRRDILAKEFQSAMVRNPRARIQFVEFSAADIETPNIEYPNRSVVYRTGDSYVPLRIAPNIKLFPKLRFEDDAPPLAFALRSKPSRRPRRYVASEDQRRKRTGRRSSRKRYTALSRMASVYRQDRSFSKSAWTRLIMSLAPKNFIR
jgi:hypothetical protein